jgi:hemerythrin-like domain-containing protein
MKGISMSHPVHTLKHEHRVIELGLRTLDSLCLRLGSGQAVPLQVLVEVHDFIRTFADQYHHGKEELCLFPALKRQGIQCDGGPLCVLTHQHEIERELLSDLYLAIDEYGSGNPESTKRFMNTARRYIEMMTWHMEFEDQILFRLAEEILDDTEKIELGKAFKQMEDQFGQGTLEKYERMASELERNWAL